MGSCAGNQPARELNLPARLELEGIPYTGATPQAMVLCYDKQVVRLVAAAAGMTVPRETFLAATFRDRKGKACDNAEADDGVHPVARFAGAL